MPAAPTATNSRTEQQNALKITGSLCHIGRRVSVVRLVTFNLLHGRSPADGLVDGGRLAEAVAALDADVLALQEVDRDQSRSGHLDLTAIAARALGAPAHQFAAAVVGTPGERFRPLTHDDDGHGEPCYGVGLVSRYPALSWRVTRLPAAPVRSPVYVPGPGGGLILLRDEPRVVLAAVLDTPYGPVTAAATHLSFVPGWNARQLRQVVRALGAAGAADPVGGPEPARRGGAAGVAVAAAGPAADVSGGRAAGAVGSRAGRSAGRAVVAAGDGGADAGVVDLGSPSAGGGTRLTA
ncbi:hypothetical protein GCM10027605_37100 [Micromonospora zhanjiangensis]